MKALQVFTLLMLATVLGAASAQQKDWYTVVGGNSFELARGSGSTYSVRIPLAPAQGASAPTGAKLVAQTIDVSSKVGRAEKLRDAFNVALEPETPTHGPSLVVATQLVDELLAGPYGLVVRLKPEPRGTTAELPAQLIALTLTVPAPELRVQPFSVDVERAFISERPPTVVAVPLQLRELSGKAGIREVKLEVLRDTVPAKPDSGQLTFSPPIGTIPPGGAASAAIAASGAYALGKTAGKLEVRSKDLPTPVSVAYEVRVIESKLWIPVLAIIGAVAGYLLRTVFKRYQEYKAALASASEFISKVAAARASSLDPTYRAALDEARAELDAATRGQKKAAVLTVAIAAAQTKVAGARTTLDTSLSNLLPRVQEFRSFVDVPWKTPGPVEEALANMRREVFLLEQDMLGRNAKAATERIARAEAGELPDIANAAGSYCSALALYATHLTSAKLPITEAAQGRLADVAALLARSYAGHWSDVPTATVLVVKTHLTTVYGDASQARAVVESLPRDALTYIDWVCTRLQLAVTEPSVQALVATTTKCLDGGVMSSEVNARTTSFDVLNGRIERLREGWVTFCQAVAPNAPASDVTNLVRDGDWQKLVDLVVQKRPQVGTRAGAGGRGAIQGEPGYSSVVLPLAVPVGGSAAVRAGTAGLDGSEGEVYRLNRDSELLAFAQTLVFAVVFVLGVFLLYADSWVGTPKEMLALFVLAFGIDLTADGVLGALRR